MRLACTDCDLQFLDLALQSRGLERAISHQHEPIGLEGLFDEVIGAAADRRDRGLDIAVAGDHDDRQIGVELLDAIEDLQAVERRALEPDVEEEEMRLAGLDRLEGFLGPSAMRAR